MIYTTKGSKSSQRTARAQSPRITVDNMQRATCQEPGQIWPTTHPPSPTLRNSAPSHVTQPLGFRYTLATLDFYPWMGLLIPAFASDDTQSTPCTIHPKCIISGHTWGSEESPEKSCVLILLSSKGEFRCRHHHLSPFFASYLVIRNTNNLLGINKLLGFFLYKQWSEIQCSFQKVSKQH